MLDSTGGLGGWVGGWVVWTDLGERRGKCRQFFGGALVSGIQGREETHRMWLFGEVGGWVGGV